MKSRSPLIIALLSTLLLGGCQNFRTGMPQEVVILSFPNEASVYINGVATGITPMTVSLPRKINHEIRLEKHGYNRAVKYFTPVPNEKAENFIRFGLSEDLGYYVDLEPGTMKAKMRSDLVPNSLGADPFEKMATQTLKADEQLEAGEITPLEHKYIVEQIIEFFAGEDPFEQMAARALSADARLESGEITPAQHKRIILEIIELFESQY